MFFFIFGIHIGYQSLFIVTQQTCLVDKRHEWCDKSVNKERRNEGTRGRRTGTRDEDEDRGPRSGNGERETLWPHLNSVLGTGNEDPPCVDMGGTSDPISRCVIIGN